MASPSRRTQRSQPARRPAEPGTLAATSARRASPHLPLVCAAALLLLSALPAVFSNAGLRAALWGAATFVVLGTISVFSSARARGRVLEFEFIARRPHYLQAILQSIIYAYWGYHFRLVYDQVPLIAAQLAFAYAFDMLLAWSRRDRYTLGFGQFPIIFSINLFIWFKPDWYYLQFVLVALGFAAKEFIRWRKDGQSAHIFNPSSFPLAIFSVVLIATGSTSMTYGVEIATTQFNPPHIYLLLFLIGLPGQYFFGVTPMTATAVVTTYLFGLAYYAATGTYFFIDSYIPISVFLGMHLLFTDPATAPKTDLGRVVYGVLYAAGNIVLYEWLGRYGIPTFYDKLLPVPLMNLSVRAIDRLAQASVLRRLDPASLLGMLAPQRRYLSYIAVWAMVFAGMSSVQAVGDEHPGHRVPFWQHACDQNLRNGCSTYTSITAKYCSDGSGWACNELGILRTEGRAGRRELAADNFQAACSLGFLTGCQNVALATGPASAVRHAPPGLRDYPVVLRTGKGALDDTTPFALYVRACDHGFMEGCQRMAGFYLRGEGTPRDPSKAMAALERSCGGRFGPGCSDLGLMLYMGDGIPQDREKGLSYLKQACAVGYSQACQWYTEQKQ